MDRANDYNITPEERLTEARIRYVEGSAQKLNRHSPEENVVPNVGLSQIESSDKNPPEESLAKAVQSQMVELPLKPIPRQVEPTPAEQVQEPTQETDCPSRDRDESATPDTSTPESEAVSPFERASMTLEEVNESIRAAEYVGKKQISQLVSRFQAVLEIITCLCIRGNLSSAQQQQMEWICQTATDTKQLHQMQSEKNTWGHIITFNTFNGNVMAENEQLEDLLDAFDVPADNEARFFEDSLNKARRSDLEVLEAELDDISKDQDKLVTLLKHPSPGSIFSTEELQQITEDIQRAKLSGRRRVFANHALGIVRTKVLPTRTIRPFRAPLAQVDKLLGQCTLPEQQRGDFAEACDEAEKLLAETQELHAKAMLTRGIVHLLQGEAKAACICLEESAEKAAKVSPELQIKSLTYAIEAAHLNCNCFPNGGAVSIRDVDACLDLTKYCEEQQQKIDLARARSGEIVPEKRLFTTQHTVMRGRQATSHPVTKALEYRLIWATQCAVEFGELFATGSLCPTTQAGRDLQLADLFSGAGERKRAIELLLKATVTYDSLGDQVGKANCQMKRGDWLVTKVGPPEVWNTVIVEASQNNELHWDVEAAESFTGCFDVDGARSCYDNARELYTKSKAKRGQAATLLRLGYLEVLATTRGVQVEICYRHAAKYIEEALTLYEQAGDRLGLQVARAQLALCRLGMDRQREDLETAKDIGRWGRETGSFSFALGLGLFFVRVGRQWQVREGDYERALACSHLSSALFEELGAQISRVVSITDQMNLYQVLEDYDQFVVTAELVFEMCLNIRLGSQRFAAPAMEQAYFVAIRIMIVANARADADAIKRAAERIRFLQGLGGIGQANSIMCLQVAVFAEQAKFLEPLYRALEARNAGENDRAQHYIEEANREAATGRAFSRAFMQATIYSYQHRHQEADTSFRQFMDQQLSIAELSSEVPELQLDWIRYTLKQGLHRFLKNKRYAEAEVYLDKLEARYGTKWWEIDGTSWEDLSLAAEVHEGQKRWDSALATYEQAMSAFEERRSQLTSDQLKLALASNSVTQQMYFKATRTALKARKAAVERSDNNLVQRNLARAFNTIERGKARSLLDLMAGKAMLGGQETQDASLLTNWRRQDAYLSILRARLADQYARKFPDQDQEQIEQLKVELATAEVELQSMTKELSGDSAFRPAQVACGEILALESVVSRIQDGVAILQYAFLGEDLLGWAITNSGVMHVLLETLAEKDLVRQVLQYHESCEQETPMGPVASALADTLLVPFDGIIDSHKRLIIVSYGVGHLLPFHALPRGEKGRPLAETHIVTYLPSTSIIQFERSTSAKSTRVLAIGNPANMRDSKDGIRPLVDLPAAATEASYIESVIQGSKALVGAEATVGKVREHISKYDILHCATHGNFDSTVPLLSCVYLANGGKLTVYDLIGLHIPADLVVLSACHTGQGKATAGDDVVGFSRALLAAGTHAVVVSLWRVDDVATSLFMGKFYRELGGGMTPPSALNAAQNYLRTRTQEQIVDELNVIQVNLEQRGCRRSTIAPIARDILLLQQRAGGDYSHPYYWAPFVLVGDSTG